MKLAGPRTSLMPSDLKNFSPSCEKGIGHGLVVYALEPAEKSDLWIPELVEIVVYAGGDAAHQLVFLVEGHEELGAAVLVVGVFLGAQQTALVVEEGRNPVWVPLAVRGNVNFPGKMKKGLNVLLGLNGLDRDSHGSPP